jgi:hypothetical protein
VTAWTPEEIRSFLTENVTVVGPGEILVIRVSDLTPNQMREWQEVLDRASGDGRIQFRCLVVYGDGLGRVQADGVTHACPPDGGGLMPCCGQTPFEVPRTDRMTLDPAQVTCGSSAEAAQ